MYLQNKKDIPKVWPRKKSDSNPTFSPSQFRLTGGNSLSISGRGTAREKHFELLAFGLILIGQVKSLFGSKQTFIDSVSSQKHQHFQTTVLSTGKY